VILCHCKGIYFLWHCQQGFVVIRKAIHGHAKGVVTVFLQYSACGINGGVGIAQVVFNKILPGTGASIYYNAAVGGEYVF
jgi:hypothetical protein